MADRIRGGEAKSSNLDSTIILCLGDLATVLVKACVCFRYSVFSAHKAIILNVGAHYARSQTNRTPYRHTFGATRLFFRARLRRTCFSLRCCVCVSPAVSHRALPRLKGEGAVCVKTSPPRCRMCFIEEKHTFQDRTDMSCDFQPPFIVGGGNTWEWYSQLSGCAIWHAWFSSQ